jgi:hypothetical protein
MSLVRAYSRVPEKGLRLMARYAKRLAVARILAADPMWRQRRHYVGALKREKVTADAARDADARTARSVASLRALGAQHGL